MRDEGFRVAPCEELRTRVGELAALPPAELPPGVREHLAGCPACNRAMAGARVTRGLLAAAADGPEPPAEFADRVLAALPGTRPLSAPTDMWRLGWGLVPAFATMAVLLLILYQSNGVPGSFGLVPAEGLSAGEQLVLESSPPEPDAVLAAVMEGDGT